MPKYNFNLRTGSNTDPDNPALLRFIVRWSGRILTYPTGETIAPRHWQRERQRAKETSAFPEHPEFNERLGALLKIAKATFRSYVTDNGREPEVEELRAALNVATGRTEQRRVDLLAFVVDFIASEEGKFNSDRKRPFHKTTLSKYRVTLDLLRTYAAQRPKASGSRSVPFAAVDADFVAGFTAFLSNRGGGASAAWRTGKAGSARRVRSKPSEGYGANTVVKYGRALRLFLRRAKEAGHPVHEAVFSRRLALKEDPSDQVYLNPDELASVYRLDLSARPGLERARDLFIVGAWTGLRFGDLSRLQPEHIEGGRIRIPTAKTGKEVWIPLHPFVRAIMDKYGGRVPAAVSNQKQNAHLKEVAGMVSDLRARVMVGRTVGGVRREVAREKWERVTTHTARRSFASNLYRNGIPARTIMGVTGHTTEQAFMRYIRLTNEEHADMLAASPLFQLAPLKAV